MPITEGCQKPIAPSTEVRESNGDEKDRVSGRLGAKLARKKRVPVFQDMRPSKLLGSDDFKVLSCSWG
jgi:hypothetical protein